MGRNENDGVGVVGLENTLGVQINPATEEGQAASSPGTSPEIYNVTMTLANTEYSQVFPVGTKSFTVRCRSLSEVKITFGAGTSGTNFITIPAGMNYYEEFVNLSTKTLYFQCVAAGKILEIIVYS